ncbi:peptidylprolyl isomerase-like protein [Trypanosoma grayi]|uniref:peptidylprolyl isomerase-like protein n=1 Tax=Trypanosoma grayi TaxID=71804 RepID=UPI0004F44473|nr:peptidylprolyl isomerase-like protein [Trypanosoma grayi]KEG13086.1 peptidylprolyl isomerase-like protein [Trypanosoma grayi]
MSSADSSVSSVDSQPMREVDYPVGVATEVPDTNGGLFKTVLVEGSGTRPVKGAKVTVHYVGTLESDGSKFDSSRDRGEYFEFTLGRGQVIKGWDKGVATMRVGEKSVLRCTPEYGYGAAGSPPKIPANATLLFEVELFDWTRDEDVSEARDKSIMKSITVDGVDYERPGYESAVTIDLRVYGGDKDSDKLLCERLGWQIVVGDTPLPPHLETCLSTMRKREAASFRVAGHRIDAPCEEFGIAAGEMVTYVVDLQELTTVKTWEFKGQARLDESERRKQQGNAAFRDGNIDVAERKYRRALEFVEHDSGFADEEKDACCALRHVVWGNLAQVLLGKRQYKESVEYCDKILEAEPHNTKALYRRAKANDALGEWDDAKRDLDQLLALDTSNADAKVLLQRVQEERKTYEKKQRAIYKNMFAS